MKHPSNRAVLKKDYQRLQEWKEGTCPYCGSKHIVDGFITPTKYKAVCIDCGNENRFSGKILRGVE